MSVTIESCEPYERPQKTKKQRQSFFAGPVSLKWLQTAAVAGGKALPVGLALLHVARLEKSSKIKVRPSVIRDFAVERHSQYRALDLLAEHGLIRIVERKRGRGPIIELLNHIPDGHKWS